MTKEDRQSSENGIWLCGICAKIIDRDFNAFPVYLLKRWKADAELRARNELGSFVVPQRPLLTSQNQTNAAVYIGPNGISINGENAVNIGPNGIKIYGPIVNNNG